MSTDALHLLSQLEESTKELNRLATAAFQLARAQIQDTQARHTDDTDWRPLPRKRAGDKCPVTGWSRSKLLRHTTRHGGPIRLKSIGRTPYYSAQDARDLIGGNACREASTDTD